MVPHIVTHWEFPHACTFAGISFCSFTREVQAGKWEVLCLRHARPLSLLNHAAAFCARCASSSVKAMRVVSKQCKSQSQHQWLKEMDIIAMLFEIGKRPPVNTFCDKADGVVAVRPVSLTTVCTCHNMARTGLWVW